MLHLLTSAKEGQTGVSSFSTPLLVTTSCSLMLEAGNVLKEKKCKSGNQMPLPQTYLWHLGYSVLSGPYL